MKAAPTDPFPAPIPDGAFAAGSVRHVIARSHQRSAALGLRRSEARGFDPLIRSDLAVARERNQRLCVHAAPVMQLLFDQVVDTESMIVLTDAQGTILHAVGDDGFLARASKVALQPGENWAEHAKGTNAIGTALFEEVPTLVHAGEHFIHANDFLTCSATPIFDPRGNILGVLDVTGDQRSYHQHTMGLVRMSARMIENHWLSDDYTRGVRLHFHNRPEFIGTLLEGILVVDLDGHLLGANRGALDQLGISSGALRAQTLVGLFGITTSAVHDHFRRRSSPPLLLHAANGRSFHAQARFDWPTPIVVSSQRAAASSARAQRAADATASAASAAPGAFRDHPPVPTLEAMGSGDPQLAAVVRQLQRATGRDIPVVLLGETGTGKASLARAWHAASRRAAHPFVVVHCASLPSSADDGSLACRVAAADGGTLLLDDVGELPALQQARLLHLLDERCITLPGHAAPLPFDVAIVSCTRHPLRDAVERGAFREDLYFRLHGLGLRLPPLRERTDLDAICRGIVASETATGAAGAPTPRIAAAVADLLRRHPWPGNLRQLGHVLRAACRMLAPGERTIGLAHLPADVADDVQAAVLARPTFERAGIDLIRSAVEAAGGNVSQAARQLGIGRNTVYRKLRAGR